MAMSEINEIRNYIKSRYDRIYELQDLRYDYPEYEHDVYIIHCQIEDAERHLQELFRMYRSQKKFPTTFVVGKTDQGTV
jgi:hypothetical protein